MKIILNVIAVFLALAVAGCSTTAPVDQQAAAVADESTPTEQQVATPAEEPTPAETESVAIQEQTAWTPEITPRGWGEHHAYFAGLDVEHYPLYMTDPHLLADSENGYFKTWDGDSALDTVAGPAIFVGNVLAIPVAAAFDPPWQTQTSRGHFPITEPVYSYPTQLSGMVENEPELDE